MVVLYDLCTNLNLATHSRLCERTNARAGDLLFPTPVWYAASVPDVVGLGSVRFLCFGP